jgi:D-xylose transport system substrate-binding protein
MKNVTTLVGLGAAVLLMTACSATTSGESETKTVDSADQLKGTVAFLTPNQTVVRWSKYDQPAMEAKLKELAPDLKIQTYNAQDDSTKQVQQAEAAITKGAKAIVMAAVDPDQTAAITAKAKDAGIPVIAYAHEANNSDPDYYVTVPFEQIGEESAKELVDQLKPEQNKIRLAKIYGDPQFFFYSEQEKGHNKILDPLIKSGAIDEVCKADSAKYDADNARKAMEQCLTKVGDKVDAVLVTNDSTANGVIAALSNDGLAGKVKVFGGYDAESGTIQQLLAGNISTDMRPPYEKMGAAAMEIVVDELTGEKPSKELVNGTYDNKKKDIPTAYLPNILVTPQNIEETLVKPGILTKDDICGGPALKSDYCKG